MDEETDLTDALADADCLEEQLGILLGGCLDCGRCASCIALSRAAGEEHEFGGEG